MKINMSQPREKRFTGNGYLVVIGLTTMILAVNAGKGAHRDLGAFIDAQIRVHEHVIRAQEASIQCLKSGSSVDDCEGQLEDDCQGIDPDACLGPNRPEPPDADTGVSAGLVNAPSMITRPIKI